MSRSIRCKMERTLSWGGDTPTGEAEVCWTYAVTFGAPARGPSYASGGQPADPDEVDDIRIVSVDGKPWPFRWSGYETVEQDEQTLLFKIEDFYDEMIEEAYEQDAFDMERELEARVGR